MIITIDGPAGTGKTTVAKKVAESLHFTYFDTGALYRAVTWVLLQQNISLSDVQKMTQALEEFAFIIKNEGSDKRYFVGEEEVTEAIRSRHVTAHVSEVAALPLVRKALWGIQHQFAEKCDVVFEGRDLGTVVFPHAEIKIFLTGRPEVRAQRRLDELKAKKALEGADIDLDKMVAEIMERDRLDSTRELAPLKCAEDAYLIDTSDLSIDEVVSLIVDHVHR